MKVLGIFWGIFGPILLLLCLGLKLGAEKDNERAAFMYKCTRQHGTPTQLADLHTRVRINEMCRGMYVSQR